MVKVTQACLQSSQGWQWAAQAQGRGKGALRRARGRQSLGETRPLPRQPGSASAPLWTRGKTGAKEESAWCGRNTAPRPATDSAPWRELPFAYEALQHPASWHQAAHAPLALAAPCKEVLMRQQERKLLATGNPPPSAPGSMEQPRSTQLGGSSILCSSISPIL